MAENLTSVMEQVDQMDADNPADMERLVQAISGGAVEPVEGSPPTDAPKGDTPTGADAPNPDTPAPAADPVAPAAPAIPEAQQGVLAKDGKNVLPWSVLEGTRKQKADAEARALQAEQQLKEAQEQLEALKSGKPTAAPKTADDIANQIAELKANAEALADEAPWLAEAQNKTIALLETMHAAMQARPPAQADPANPAEPSDDPVRAAIDATPALAHFESNQPEIFAYAVQVDSRLREQSAWKDKPLTERFAKVVEIVRATHGDEVLPPELRQATTPATTPGIKTVPPADAPAISSLTDLPGGTPTAMNPLQAMDSASPTAIANSLAKLDNPDDIIRFITS